MSIDEIKDALNNAKINIDTINCNGIMCKDCPCHNTDEARCEARWLRVKLESTIERGKDL